MPLPLLPPSTASVQHRSAGRSTLPGAVPDRPRFQSAGRLRLSVQRIHPPLANLELTGLRVAAAPLRAGAFVVALLAPQGGATQVMRFEADGSMSWNLTIPPHEGGLPEGDGRGAGDPSAWTATGFAACGLDGFALAFTGPTPQGTRLRGYGADGSTRWEVHDFLDSGSSHDGLQRQGAPAGRRPLPGAPVALASGQGYLGLHCAHLARWPDGSLVQGGFARSLRMPSQRPDRSLASATLGATRPWIGSRSLQQRCAHDPHREDFVLAALSDGFPRAILVSRLGTGAWRDQVLQWLPGEPGASDLAAELGGLVVLRESCAVSFTATVAAQPESRDLFVGFVQPDLRATPLLMKVTHHAPGTQAVRPRLAAMGRHLLASWTCLSPTTGDSMPMVAVITPQAQLLLPPQTIAGLRLDASSDFVTDAQGAVNWFALQPDGLHWNRVRFARGPWRQTGPVPQGSAKRRPEPGTSEHDGREGRLA